MSEPRNRPPCSAYLSGPSTLEWCLLEAGHAGPHEYPLPRRGTTADQQAEAEARIRRLERAFRHPEAFDD